MTQLQPFLLYSFIPVLLASMILFYYILQSPKKRKATPVTTLLIQADEMEIFYPQNNYNLIVSFQHPNTNQSYSTSNCQATINSTIIVQCKPSSNKKYLSRCDEGLEYIRYANRSYRNRQQYMNWSALKKQRKYRHKAKRNYQYGFDPTNLPTIFEQKQY